MKPPIHSVHRHFSPPPSITVKTVSAHHEDRRISYPSESTKPRLVSKREQRNIKGGFWVSPSESEASMSPSRIHDVSDDNASATDTPKDDSAHVNGQYESDPGGEIMGVSRTDATLHL